MSADAQKVFITTAFIKLDQLLKHANLVGGGGEAKMVISSGEVTVNGEVEVRRGRKIHPGDLVEVGGEAILIEGDG